MIGGTHKTVSIPEYNCMMHNIFYYPVESKILVIIVHEKEILVTWRCKENLRHTRYFWLTLLCFVFPVTLEFLGFHSI